MIEYQLEFLHPTPRYRELCILMELEREPRSSQKRIANKVGLAPSMVNTYIKSFVERGLLMCSGENHRNMLYHVTPSGRELKMDLLVHFLHETVLLFKIGKDEIRQKLLSFIKEGIKRVVLFGANDICEVLIGTFHGMDIGILAVVDVNPDRWGNDVQGFKVKPPDEIFRINPDGVIVMANGMEDQDYLDIEALEEAGIKVRKL